MEEHLPIRCRAEEVAEQLRLVVKGLPFLADRSWEEVGWGRMRIELLTLWRVELLLEPGGRSMDGKPTNGRATGDRAPLTSAISDELALSLVMWAAAPDGRCWDYGCQRDDWTLGPDSRLVEPLQFLGADERSELEALLREARCWPEPIAHAPLAPVLVLEERIRIRRRRRRQKRSCAENP